MLMFYDVPHQKRLWCDLKRRLIFSTGLESVVFRCLFCFDSTDFRCSVEFAGQRVPEHQSSKLPLCFINEELSSGSQSVVSAVRPSWGQTAAVMWGLVLHPFFRGISTSLWLSLCCHFSIHLIKKKKLREITAVFWQVCIFKPGTHRLHAGETTACVLGCWSQHGLLAALLKLLWN